MSALTTPTTPAPAATPAPRPRVHYPIGWLRGLAAMAVLIFHAYQHSRSGAQGTWPFGGGLHQTMLGTELFVEMFFVLSGFVLWLPIAQDLIDGRVGRPGWVLLARRAARLVPLYLVVVLVVWTVTNPSLPGHWADLFLHLTFTQVYSDQYIFWTIGPAWTLAVEFHFYLAMALVVPLVHRHALRRPTRRGRIAVVSLFPLALAVLGVAYLAWNIHVAQPPHENWSVWFSPLSRAADFGIGTALAVVVAAGVRLGPVSRGTLAVVGTVALVVLVASRPLTLLGAWWHPGYAAGVAVALAAVVLHDGPWPRALEWAPLARIGMLGYGIYLIHEPVMRLLGHLGLLPDPRPGLTFLLTAVLVAVPTLALAWLSSRTVETAGLKLLSLIERDGSPRDYYAHLDEPAGQDSSASASGSTSEAPADRSAREASASVQPVTTRSSTSSTERPSSAPGSSSSE